VFRLPAYAPDLNPVDRPGLIEGCLAGTGLALEPGETPVDIVN